MTILGLKGILTSMLPDHLWKNFLTFSSMRHKHIDHTLHIAGHWHFFPVCQHKISGTVNITHAMDCGAKFAAKVCSLEGAFGYGTAIID